MDAGSKGQKIGELQRESMTFKSMVEESNKVVTQLKVTISTSREEKEKLTLDLEDARAKSRGLQNEIVELRGTIQSREFDLEKSRVALERSKKDFEGLQDSYDQLKSDLDKARKTYHEQREKFELEQTEFKHQLKIKESHLKSANDEILVLRDQSGGATKALSK